MEQVNRNVNLSIDEFAKGLVKAISLSLGSEYEVVTRKVNKNNDIVLTGIEIKDIRVNTAPLMYVDYYYDAYVNGRMSDGEVMANILKIFHERRYTTNIDFSMFLDWDFVKDKVSCMLINYDKNKDELKLKPHIRFLDLAIVFKVELGCKNDVLGSIYINNKHINMWNVDAFTLYEQARLNMEEPVIEDILDILKRQLKRNMPENLELFDELHMFEGRLPMYVISNKACVNGSSMILHTKALESLSQSLDSDLYIIPSSIHECILIPANEIPYEDSQEEMIEHLREMVAEVNVKELLPEQILSDNIYVFDRETSVISIVG